MLCNDLGSQCRQRFPSDKFLSGGKCFNKSLCYGEKTFFIMDFIRDFYRDDTIDFVEMFILDSCDNEINSVPLDFEIMDKYVKIVIDLNSNPENLNIGEKYSVIIRAHSDESIITKILKFTLLDSLGKNITTNPHNKVVVINSNITVNQTTTTTTNSCTICNCNTCTCN